MVKRRRLETPSHADLDRIEKEFRSETSDRPMPARGIAPIAQVAADSAAQSQTADADARAARAKLESDAARLHAAQKQGLLMVELPIDQIDEGAMIRDRMTLNEEDMHELRQSIAAHGLRLPIEVFELEKPGKAGRVYGLLSGYRRLLATRALQEMTDADKYRVIRAVIRPREDSGGAFVSMIEENEVREELSQFERGRIAVIAADQGAFANTEEAVAKLFATGSKAKRSKIRSFALIFEELGDMLRFPEGLTERRGLQLASALRRGAENQLRNALSQAGSADAEEEWAVIEPVLRRLDSDDHEPTRGGRPKTRTAGVIWDDGGAVRVSSGITMRRGADSRGQLLRFEGAGATDEVINALMAKIQVALEEQ